jgi:hypothetical protein
MACGQEYDMVAPTSQVTRIDGTVETVSMPEKSYCVVKGVKAEYQVLSSK